MQENKQEKSLIKRNISRYLEEKGVSDYEFYKKSGITRGILRQPNGISEDNIAKFLAYAPDVNPEWLVTGNGPMMRQEEVGVMQLPPLPDKPKSTHEAPGELVLELLDRITEQAAEIGRLKELVRQLQRGKGLDASDVPTSGVANAG